VRPPWTTKKFGWKSESASASAANTITWPEPASRRSDSSAQPSNAAEYASWMRSFASPRASVIESCAGEASWRRPISRTRSRSSSSASESALDPTGAGAGAGSFAACGGADGAGAPLGAAESLPGFGPSRAARIFSAASIRLYGLFGLRASWSTYQVYGRGSR
jgi:hypothetical protein